MNYMLKVFIVDDEPLARDELKYLLKRSKQVEIIGEAEGVEDAAELIPKLCPDIVFLDIQLSEDSGLQVAEALKASAHPPVVVFATAYDEYALKAFELNAVDYILKPFDEERIQQTLEKIGRLRKTGEKTEGSAPIQPSYAERMNKLAITVDERILLVDIEKIVFAGLIEGKTVIKTLDAEYKISDTLVVLERKLSQSFFIRVHRSFIINLHHIAEIQPWFNSTYNLIMQDGSKVPVSRTYVKELKQKLGF
jgi:two-component system response regulator LytT